VVGHVNDDRIPALAAAFQGVKHPADMVIVVFDHAVVVTAMAAHGCGPTMMIKACTSMLTKLGVAPTQIAYDEFLGSVYGEIGKLLVSSNLTGPAI